jgi:hypothetical protein
MSKKLFSVVLIGFGLAFAPTVLQAKNGGGKGLFGLPKALSAHLAGLKAKAKAKKGKDDESADCVNFSGSWQGVCTSSDGESWDDRFDVEQESCGELTMDGVTLPIGGAAKVDQDGQAYTLDMTIFPQWGSSRNALNARYSLAYRATDVDVYGFGRGVIVMELIDNKLVSRSTNETEWETSGQVNVTNQTDECVYERAER